MNWIKRYLTKRGNRLAEIKRLERAAESYDEMAQFSKDVKDVPWSEYCMVMASIRRADAETHRRLL